MSKEKILLGGIATVAAWVAARIFSSESVQSALNSKEKDLKSSGANFKGDVVKKVKKIAVNVGNIADACISYPIASPEKNKIRANDAGILLSKGDHIYVDRWFPYSHHGIYDGNGFVIEYNKHEIRYTTLTAFIGNNSYVHKVDSEAIYSPETISAVFSTKDVFWVSPVSSGPRESNQS